MCFSEWVFGFGFVLSDFFRLINLIYNFDKIVLLYVYI